MIKLPAGFDVETIAIFLVVAEKRSMSQAARLLGITQSAVSQAIARLEIGIGAQLFDRSLRPLTLTPGGELLQDRGDALVATARRIVDDIRRRGRQPFERVTIAMAESLANHLTAPLIAQLGERARHWQIRSGISLLQHAEFAARKLDILVTGSSSLQATHKFAIHPVVEEEFVVIVPISHDGPIDNLKSLTDRPFVRFSSLSGMGQRIEHQLGRLKLSLPIHLEVDSIWQQLSTVTAGLGWSLTTPLCLASHLELLPGLRVARLRRGGFRRRISVIARNDEFGDLPGEIARIARESLPFGRVSDLAASRPELVGALDIAC